MQIEYSSNFVNALTRTAATPSGGSLNAKFTFKETFPTNHFTWIDRPMNALQLCH